MEIPLSSSNPIIEEIFKSKTKKRVLVFNKCELADNNARKVLFYYLLVLYKKLIVKFMQKLTTLLQDDQQSVVFTSCKMDARNRNSHPKRILRRAVKLLPQQFISSDGMRKVYHCKYFLSNF